MNSNTQSPFPPHSHVVAYLRDSGGDDQDLSIAQQQEVITAWCVEHQLTLSETFADAAKPGSSTIGRDQFHAMIERLRDPNCVDAGLILWKFSRFSREIDDAQFYRADLRRRGRIIHSIQDNIPDTTDGRIYEALLDWMNNKFLEDMSVDVKRGLKHLVSNYRAVPGTPPFGFKREVFTVGNRRDGTAHNVSRWVHDSETIDICKLAWLMRSKGSSLREIHKELHFFKAVNSYTTFFTNRIYIGQLKYGDVFIEDYCEPLVTQDIWDTVQTMAKKNSPKFSPLLRDNNPEHPRRDHSSFLLSGLIYCPRCGSIMNGIVISQVNQKKYEYYGCSRSHRNVDCDARQISKNQIEEAVIKKLLEFVLDPRLIHERDLEQLESSSDSQKNIENEIKRVLTDLKTNEKNRNNLAAHLMSIAGQSTTLTTNLLALEADERDLKSKLTELRLSKNQNTTKVREIKDLEKFVLKFKKMLISDDIQKRRWAVRTLLHKVVAEKDKSGNTFGMVYFYNPQTSSEKKSL